MPKTKAARPTWKKLLEREGLVLLPAAHDALTARLIERAGFPAFQVGGFALVGARHGFPDLDLCHYAEQSAAFRDILEACSLPVLIDADDGYGDVKNVTRTVRGYEALGASAMFIEDQRAPKRCGHLAGKEVIPPRVMVERLKAASAARRSPDTFLVARSDAIEPKGIDDALRRGELYLKAGADGLFIEGPHTVKHIERIAGAFRGSPLMVNMFEGGGKTPWVPPKELKALGFSMVLFPTTVLFQAVRAIERALDTLKAGRQMDPEDGVDFDHFEKIVGLDGWADLEKRFGRGEEAQSEE